MFVTDITEGRIWINPKYIVLIRPNTEERGGTIIAMVSMDDDTFQIVVDESIDNIVAMMHNPITQFTESNYYKALTEDAAN